MTAKTTKFVSRSPNQVLCIRPSRPQIVEGIVVPVPGQHIRFEQGEYETSDVKEIKFIREHRLFGGAIIEDKKADAAAE